MTRSAGRIIAAGFLCLVALAGEAAAQAYPSRPIRMVVPYPPGGPADFFGRGLATALRARLDQTVLIDNRGGATGMTGTDNVAKSPPDGYSLLLNSPASLAIVPAISETMPYDTFRDLTPISLVVVVPEAVVASPKLGVRTLAAFIAHAKANPGKLNMASAGSAGMPHLAGELLQREAGFTATHVPYRGAAPAVNDLLSGQVDFMFADLPVLAGPLQSGLLIGLALGSPTRAAALPDLPTTAEAGYPGLIVENWYGLFAPAATPPDILQKLVAATTAAVADPEFVALMAKQGAVATASTPQALADRLRADALKWGGLAKSIGARLD